MISYLNGQIITKGKNYVIVRANNVGYKVFINSEIANLTENEEIELFTHQYVREDALDLYGFRTMAELEMFELLLSISGIGPKSALGVLSVANVSDLKSSISRGDPTLLTKVSGIGKKTAERVVLELRDKINELIWQGQSKSDISKVSSDEIDALMALGYSLMQAREALKRVDSKVKDSGERIKQALQMLGK